MEGTVTHRANESLPMESSAESSQWIRWGILQKLGCSPAWCLI